MSRRINWERRLARRISHRRKLRERHTHLVRTGKRVDNRSIRYAINTLSGYVNSSRTSAAQAKKAVAFLTSQDLSRNYGRRGGVTRGNASAALRLLAEYEDKTGRRLRRLGGFSRKTLELVKRGFGLRAIERGVGT